MKKVILEDKSKDVITVPECSDRYYYGFEVNGKERGFITQTNYGSNKCVAMSADGVTKGNCYMSLERNLSLFAMLEKMAGHDGFEVYYFSTPQELFKWLSED